VLRYYKESLEALIVVSILFCFSFSFLLRYAVLPILFQFIRVGVFIFYIVLRTFFYDFSSYSRSIVGFWLDWCIILVFFQIAILILSSSFSSFNFTYFFVHNGIYYYVLSLNILTIQKWITCRKTHNLFPFYFYFTK
jgi:hypothetical protein